MHIRRKPDARQVRLLRANDLIEARIYHTFECNTITAWWIGRTGLCCAFGAGDLTGVSDWPNAPLLPKLALSRFDGDPFWIKLRPDSTAVSPMKNTATIVVAMLIGTAASSAQTMLHDPPWNPEHIAHLPPEVRQAVLAMCATEPSAGHYFATYGHDRVTLHYEHIHCGQGASAYCKGSQCLHQVYQATNGHYSLIKSGFGPEND
jgi:hypothetical protein